MLGFSSQMDQLNQSTSVFPRKLKEAVKVTEYLTWEIGGQKNQGGINSQKIIKDPKQMVQSVRYPEPEWVCKIKFIIFSFTRFSVFELFNDKIEQIKEKPLLSLSTA